MHRSGMSNDKVSSSAMMSSNNNNGGGPGGACAPVSLDEAIGLLKDRQNATNSLNNLLQQEMNDQKVCESYHAFRVRYLRALGKLHPVGYEEPNKCADSVAFLKNLRQSEKEKKTRYSQLKDAWLFYDSVAIDKPEVLSAEDQKIEKELDEIEQEIHEEWQDFAEEVIARAENDGKHDDAEVNEWRLDLKELKKDLKHLKMRKSERDEFRKRAEMRRIKDIVRARRNGGSTTEEEFSESEGGCSTDDGAESSRVSKRKKKRRDRDKDKKSSSSKSSKKEKSKKKKEKEVEEVEDGSNELLSEVFPPHIAKALSEGRKVEPESKECVTIFFSDIVGFTHISATITPLKVSQMLDRLYQKFDHLSREHDVYKVETIGDSWMGVTNLTKDQPDHAQRIAHFALDALKAAQSTFIDEENYNLGKLNLRVGFHSGPVVANVVGSRNPRYCLFGDTVNTASRMESHSQAGRIQCSDSSADILKQAEGSGLRLVSRGQIDIKGKGLMETFFVEDEFAESTAANDLPPPPSLVQASPQMTQGPPPLMPAHKTYSSKTKGSDKTEESRGSDSSEKAEEDEHDDDPVREKPARSKSFGGLRFWKRNNDEPEDDAKKTGLFGKILGAGNRRASMDGSTPPEAPAPSLNRRASLGSIPPKATRTKSIEGTAGKASLGPPRPRQRPSLDTAMAQSQRIPASDPPARARTKHQASSPNLSGVARTEPRGGKRPKPKAPKAEQPKAEAEQPKVEPVASLGRTRHVVASLPGDLSDQRSALIKTTKSKPEAQPETAQKPEAESTAETGPKINKFLARSIDSLKGSEKLSAADVIKSLNEVYEMVKSSEVRRDEFGSGGGIPIFMDILNRSTDDTSVLEAAFRLLSVLAQSDSNRDELAQKESIERVLEAMTKHTDCVALQQWGCESLAGFAKTPKYQDEIVDHDGLDVIMATQKEHEQQGEVQVACFRALNNLAQHHSENSFNIAANGGIWAIMGVLQSKSFPLATVIDLHVEAFRAMAELARGSESNRGSLATAGAIPKLIGAMSCFTKNANLVEAGIDALHCMSIEHSQNSDTIVAYDGIRIIMGFMKKHHKHAGVQEKAVWLFTDLMENSSTAQMKIPDGCLETIEQAIEKFPDYKNLQEQGKDLLKEMDPSRT